MFNRSTIGRVSWRAIQTSSPSCSRACGDHGSWHLLQATRRPRANLPMSFSASRRVSRILPLFSRPITRRRLPAMSSGDLKAAHEHADAVLAIYRKDVHRQHALLYGGHDPAVCSYAQDAIVLQILGYPERALVQLNQGLMLARELEHPPSTVHALWFGAETNFHRRDPRRVMRNSRGMVTDGFSPRLCRGNRQRDDVAGVEHWSYPDNVRRDSPSFAMASVASGRPALRSMCRTA